MKLTVHQEHAARCDAERQADRLERSADLDLKAAKLLSTGRARVVFESGCASIRQLLLELDRKKGEKISADTTPILPDRLEQAAGAAALGALYGRAMRDRVAAKNLVAAGWWYRERFNESAPSRPPPKSNGADDTGAGKYERQNQIRSS